MDNPTLADANERYQAAKMAERMHIAGLSSDEVKAILQRTVEWLEANPENHIKDYLAARREFPTTWTDAAGYTSVSIHDERADCFCTIGRLLHEIGPQTSQALGWVLTANLFLKRVDEIAEDTTFSAQQIANINDDNPANARAYLRTVLEATN